MSELDKLGAIVSVFFILTFIQFVLVHIQLDSIEKKLDQLLKEKTK